MRGQDCSKCGFRRLWYNGLSKTLFCSEEGEESVGSKDGQSGGQSDVDGLDNEDENINKYSSESLIEKAPLSCREWTKKAIDWRYYTHQAAPTVAAHAQDVARQATAACHAALNQSVVTKDKEYNPSEPAVTRDLVLATMRGILVVFLDSFEKLSEKYALHRNLVSTERRAQINHDRKVLP